MSGPRAPRFWVGVNLPWGDFCGHDFGLHPYGWEGPRQDWSGVEARLKALRALGVTLVRWFVLASGVNYPCRAEGPTRSPDARGQVRQAVDDWARRVPEGARRFEFEWRGAPAPLSEAFLDDFVALCRACRAAGLQLLPSLLSFEWFQPPLPKPKGVFGGGRARLALGGPGEDARGAASRFLQATLGPLLRRTREVFGAPDAAAPEAHPIFAWESVNEPDWVVQDGPRLLRAPSRRVAAHAMSALLDEHRRMVLEAGFDHTIGFKQLAPTWLDPALRAALLADGPRYWHQGHHYPTLGRGPWGERQLATNRVLPPRPPEFARCLIGELPTAQGSAIQPSNWRWGDPELRLSERDPGRYLRARLELVRARGYDGALLWSATPGCDGRTRWDASVCSQVRQFSADLHQRPD